MRIKLPLEVPQVLFRLSRWENLRTCQGKFDQDAKDRVVRLVAHSEAMNASPLDVRGHVTKRLPEDLVAEKARLRRENQKLRDTNELLKAASAFFASEPDLKR
ncbi:hypothetical protein FRC0485_02097 [Corynebacterium diphtheriae]|nr:hypothetical protein FRC0485_02097 [Corynebacterium diphtheriae]